MKVASSHKIYSEISFLIWLESLPLVLSRKEKNELLIKAEQRKGKIVVWVRWEGFNFFN